jgi:hypothetical protein
MMKKWMMIAVMTVVVFACASFVKDITIKMAVEKGTELVTGLRLKMGGLRVGIIRQVVSIKDLKIFNPEGYKDKVMLDMPEIYLNEVRINMKEFTVVKNAKGELNLDSLKVVKSQKEGSSAVKEEKDGTLKMHIGKLYLKVGKVYYKDYSKGGEPTVTEYNLNLDEKYTDIDDPYSLVSLIVVKSLNGTSIGRLANFDVKGLSGTIGDTLSTATSGATKTVSKAKAAAEEAAKGASETVKNASETIKNMLPFGKK